MIAVKYGWDRISEQQLFQPIVDQLEPAAQASFLEETEAGIPVIYFDGYEAAVKQWSMKELDEEKE
jgi:hypothetical protein